MPVTDRRTQLYLTEEQHAAALHAARERGTSLAAIVREALDRYLASAASRAVAPWSEDPARTLVGSLDLPPLAGDDDLDEAIDASVYDEP